MIVDYLTRITGNDLALLPFLSPDQMPLRGATKPVEAAEVDLCRIWQAPASSSYGGRAV
ncbi:hypothetical protein ONA91_15370 [Micromonospora sp. DR5-3]|uniref:hypothetical protein n=1 Tax=unclassified Micromonospora TaxID=2617518 RepID=UPI0016529DC2|nr:MULTISPECIES: hypothetical protein [unclassified Micromonospora]MCW3815825.1 hypothetical protein [Micromonospora sp. DR5-3]